MMLEHFYDEVIKSYLSTDQQKALDRDLFIENMVKVRGPAVITAPSNNGGSGSISQFVSWLVGLLPRLLKFIYSKISGTTSAHAEDLNKSHRQLISDLPVITFMERLGSSVFAEALDDTPITTKTFNVASGSVTKEGHASK